MSFLAALDSQISAPGFRKDINALRTVAFLSVLLYHFRVPGFHGGFAGVDSFLVISGYLMMSIIDRQVAQRQFKLLAFYSRRIAQLAAPLVLVVLPVIAVGWLTLSPSDMRALGRHAVSALTFTSNFTFWRESGYFNSDNARRFLLHTWSLSLEVQFYLIAPAIYFLLRGLSKGNGLSRVLPLALLTTLLFAFSIWSAQFKPIPAFYLLPTRLWEFLAGSLVFQLIHYRPITGLAARAAHVAGFGMLAVSAIFSDGSAGWPGWFAVMPVLGTSLVIFSQEQSGRLLTSRAVQALGSISYSGYLWHWPILVGLVVSDLIDTVAYRVVGMALSLFIGGLSWMYAEQRFGNWLERLSTGKRIPSLAALIASAAVVPSLAVVTAGFPGRFSPATAAFLDSAEVHPQTRFCEGSWEEHCLVSAVAVVDEGSSAMIGAIVIGDSHAGMIAQVVADALPDDRSRVAMFKESACPTIQGISVVLDLAGNCRSQLDSLLASQVIAPDGPVILANRYSFYLHGPNET